MVKTETDNSHSLLSPCIYAIENEPRLIAAHYTVDSKLAVC